MKITLVCVGRPRGPLATAISAYEERLRHYFRFEAIEVKETPFRGQPVSIVQDDEGSRLLARIPEQTEVITLNREGLAWNTEDLTEHLAQGAVDGSPGCHFVIGGAYGLGSTVLERADRRLSLSAMTLPHELARLVLTEQLYRAGTIIRGEPYHKGRGNSG